MRIFQESPRVNGGNRFIFQWSCSNFFSRAIDNGLKTIQTNKNLDRYIDRLSADSRPIYRTAIFWLLTKCRPITDRYIGQVSTNYRRSVGEKSAKCRWTKNYIGRDTSRTTIDRVSTECPPTIDCYIDRASTEYRPTVDRVSTDYRPSVDRLSTECRPTIDRVSAAISRSILPTVNKIRKAKNS